MKRINKLYKKLVFAIVFISGMFLTSCTDFLTIIPPSMVVHEDFWHTEAEVNGMMATAYLTLCNRNCLSNAIVWGETRAETVDYPTGSTNESILRLTEGLLYDDNGYASWSEYYKAISGDSEMVDIVYDSELSKASLDMLLEASYEKDRIMKYTTSGIQRDDFIFTMNGHPIRRYGSQGQQKSFLVSLKFAQYEIMKRNYGFAPILLLDDVFDKLDMGRISNLLQMVASNDFGQIFITDSNKVRMSGIVDRLTQDRAYFETVSGTFSRI